MYKEQESARASSSPSISSISMLRIKPVATCWASTPNVIVIGFSMGKGLRPPSERNLAMVLPEPHLEATVLKFRDDECRETVLLQLSSSDCKFSRVRSLSARNPGSGGPVSGSVGRPHAY